MKIVGFAQLHEELRRGFLPWWMESMERVCDVIYIWDQNSQDGSRDYYREHPKCVVHEHHCNDFLREIACKRQLLAQVKQEQPDADWIFSMDGDTVLEELAHRKIRPYLETTKADNVLLHHLNLWRGNTHHRVDSGFDGKVNGHVCLWRVNDTCEIAPAHGLHKPQYPVGRDSEVAPYHLLHFGFGTDEALYERMHGKLPRRDPNVANHKKHYLLPSLVAIPPEFLPPYIPRIESIATPLPSRT